MTAQNDGQTSIPYLQTTFTLKPSHGDFIPYQNGIPVPTFDPQQRRIIRLNGTWRKERFAADHALSMAPRTDFWKEQMEASAGGRTEAAYDDSQWELIQLPRPENRLSGVEAAQAAETYEDGVWYRRNFTIERLEGQAYTLKCLGISYVCDLWLNGVWIGYHEGGFTPFAFNVAAALREGENTIAVRVDNPPWGSREDTIPAKADTDFFNYTGIVQDLFIEAVPCVHIARLDVVPQDVNGWVELRAVIENRSNQEATVRYNGQIFEAVSALDVRLSSPYAADIKGERAETEGFAAGMLELQPFDIRFVRWNVNIRQAKLWTMDNPNLYVAELSVETNGGSDTLATQFGIRTLRTEGTRLLLNEQSVFLRGIAKHEEWPEYGRTAAWDRIAADLLQIGKLNANLVRPGHYPNHVYTYLLTDRLGLATMSEVPMWQFDTVHFEIQAVKRLSDQMWREMIFSEYNRPSVLMWSTQNESKEVGLRTAYNARVAQDLRDHYDDGRLTTQSAAADQPGAHDASMEPLDVAGWTMYFGIFHGGTPYEGTVDFLEKAYACWPGKPILNTEFGHWSQENDEAADRQVEIHQETFRALMEKATISQDGKANQKGFVVGIDFWTMYNWYVNHNQWTQTMGIYHMDRTSEKPVKKYLEADYGKLKGCSR